MTHDIVFDMSLIHLEGAISERKSWLTARAPHSLQGLILLLTFAFDGFSSIGS
jgi:hypothetical protein